MASLDDYLLLKNNILDEYYSGQRKVPIDYAAPQLIPFDEFKANLQEAMLQRAYEAYASTSAEARFSDSMRKAGVNVQGGYPQEVAINPKDEQQKKLALMKLRGLLENYSNEDLHKVAPYLESQMEHLSWGKAGNVDREMLGSLSQVFKERGQSFLENYAEGELDSQLKPSLAKIFFSKLGL